VRKTVSGSGGGFSAKVNIESEKRGGRLLVRDEEEDWASNVQWDRRKGLRDKGRERKLGNGHHNQDTVDPSAERQIMKRKTREKGESSLKGQTWGKTPLAPSKLGGEKEPNKRNPRTIIGEG